jgi:pimeloyl-ACP methyl ester carboxylesterase
LTGLFAVLFLGGAPAQAEGPALVPSETRITTSEDLRWAVNFSIINPLAGGLYMDSVYCDMEDLDPGETRAPRTTRMNLQHLLAIIPNLSAGENGYFLFEGSAACEKANLDFHLVTHDAAGTVYRLAARIEAGPGPLAERCPSRLLTVQGRAVEVVLVPAVRDSARGPGPGLLLVHGEAGNARKMLRTALLLSHRGYTVALVSQPGYGLSAGPPDLMGPATVRAALAALDLLAVSPRVDPKRLGVWGVERGATVAMELAMRRGDLAAVVAQSGVYDLWAAGRGAPARRDAIVAEAGRDSSGWRERSPALESPGKVGAAILFLHDEQDPDVPFAQALGYYEALRAASVRVQSKFFPSTGHHMPRGEALSVATAFLARELHP